MGEQDSQKNPKPTHKQCLLAQVETLAVNKYNSEQFTSESYSSV